MNDIFFITDHGAREVQNMRQSRDSLSPQDLGALSLMFNQREALNISNNIAEIKIQGPLLSQATELEKAMGATDYFDIIAEIEEANNQSAKSILLSINTPGGSVAGIEETYAAIKESKAPVYAYNEGSAASAGYYLAAACDKICASPSAITGSIGTILTIQDFSKLEESMGITTKTITNTGADLKGTGSGALTEKQEQFLQDMVDDLGQQFLSRVQQNRENVDMEVARAGWYYPKDALALGLIDFMGNKEAFKETINALTN